MCVSQKLLGQRERAAMDKRLYVSVHVYVHADGACVGVHTHAACFLRARHMLQHPDSSAGPLRRL